MDAQSDVFEGSSLELSPSQKREEITALPREWNRESEYDQVRVAGDWSYAINNISK